MNKNLDLYDIADQVSSRQDFERFLKLLRDDLLSNKEDWDNNTLEMFLDGLYGYNYDSANDEATWWEMARMLLAARVYE